MFCVGGVHDAEAHGYCEMSVYYAIILLDLMDGDIFHDGSFFIAVIGVALVPGGHGRFFELNTGLIGLLI